MFSCSRNHRRARRSTTNTLEKCHIGSDNTHSGTGRRTSSTQRQTASAFCNTTASAAVAEPKRKQNRQQDLSKGNNPRDIEMICGSADCGSKISRSSRRNSSKPTVYYAVWNAGFNFFPVFRAFKTLYIPDKSANGGTVM